MSKDQETKEVQELTQKLAELERQMDAADVEAREWADKRDKTNGQLRKIRGEIIELRSTRDKLNEEVHNLKLQRNALKEKILEQIEKTKGLRENRKTLIERIPPKSRQELQEEVESIDWKIQTDSPSLLEEKELVDQVRKLEVQLNVHRKYEQLNKNIHEIQDEIRTIDAQNRLIHETLARTAQRSQETHQRMMERLGESRRVREEADGFHQRLLQTKERIRSIREQMREVSSRLGELKGKMSAEMRRKKMETEENLRRKLETEAREKLKRGDKLSFAEFQLLADSEEKNRD